MAMTMGQIAGVVTVATVLMAPAAGRGDELAAVATTLAERLRAPAAPAHAPRFFNAIGTAVRCVALTATEVRSGGRHIFACATTDGEVLGGFLNRKGKPVCEPITGTFDAGTECWTLTICGQGFDGCFPTG
jgi:hypothetical protein